MRWAEETGGDEVIVTIDWLEQQAAVYQVNGGWAVDALVGRQTRPHRDLDVFVDAVIVPDLLEYLAGLGYEVVENWLPVRVELAGSRGRVDVHPMLIRVGDDGVQAGLSGEEFVHAAKDRTLGAIQGRTVVVANAQRLRELRSGYALRVEDHHDLILLEELIPGE